MNLRKKLLLLSISIAFLHITAFAQRDTIPLTTIIAKTSKVMNDHPTEKVYLHFDKPYYAVNDTLWLKAYVTVDLHQLSPLSRVLYIDITDENNQLIDELKLQLVNGMANGNTVLTPVYYKGGNYHIRAYTRWMRNFDQSYFFNKTITIGNTQTGRVVSHISFKNTITEKSAKINATVVYKDQDGKPIAGKKVNWKVDNDDNTISKGKGETDPNGVLNISFTSDKQADVAAAAITTEVVMDEKEKRAVTKIFGIEMTPTGIDMQFFPEGGNLVNGIRSRVAFKAIKPDGLGIDVKGTVTDNSGTVIANITSQHLGMGVFAISPEDGKSYKANVTFTDGSHGSFDLPNAREEGINIALNNTDADSLSIKMVANDGFFQKNQNKTFYVIAQSGGVICYAAQAVLKSAVYGAMIPKSKFPTGVVQVTVLSSKGAPLTERIAFIQNNDQLNLNLRTDQSSYLGRQKVKLQVSAKNKTLPAEGNFSVAVIDETTVPYDENDETTILTYLLLTSDLKGYIEKPNYYFNHPGEQTNNDLDVLMLTQGYRRFSYKNIIADKTPPIGFLPEQGIDISGTLRSNTGIPVAKGSVRMFIPDKGFSTTAQTDMSGNFRFSNITIADTSKVTLNARDNPNGSNLVLTVDGFTPPPSTQYIYNIGGMVNIDSAMRPYLQNSKKQFNTTHNLREVVVKAVNIVKKPSHSDYPSLVGLSMEADHTVPGERFKGCPVFTDCLTSAALGLTLDNANLYITKSYNNGNRQPVAYYVDGRAVDFNYLASLNSDNVESAEIFLSDGLSGISRTTNTKGVLEINTKKQPKGEKISQAQLMDLLPKRYMAEFIPGGYNVARQFYLPKYSHPASQADNTDYRSTIYWNPAVLTDKTGVASFEFFNGDGTGTYKAVIEGMDKDGNVGRYVYRYKVQ